jgi:hypothetical protein
MSLMVDPAHSLRKSSLSLIHALHFHIPVEFGRALLISQALALVWWLVAMWLRGHTSVPVWYDQQVTFTQVPLRLANPYEIYFVNPPWTAVLLIPFGLMPLPLSVLVQLCLYFAILTAVIFRYKGGIWIVLLALTSYIAFDSALELNVDWLACLGLLVPPAWSGPFLWVKPQTALGVWLSFQPRDVVRAVIVTLLLLIVSLIIWGDWLSPLLHYMSSQMQREFNMAPMGLLPAPVGVLIALGIGIVLARIAFRRRDPVLSILAWLFFVPYIKIYSLLLPLALLGIRLPRFALLVSTVMWLVYGGVIVRYFLLL